LINSFIFASVNGEDGEKMSRLPIQPIPMPYLKEALDLVWDVFSEFEAPGYSPQGREEFRKFIAFDDMKEKLESGEYFMWIYLLNNKIAGVIATRPVNHISLLFVDKKYHRTGIARSLTDIVIEFLKENFNAEEITVNSSPYAVEIYHKMGFTDTNVSQTVNGICFTPMKRMIALVD